MTQSLAGIKSLKTGCGDDASHGFSGRMSMAYSFPSSPDSTAAERFQSAMAVFAATSIECTLLEEREAAGRDAPIVPLGIIKPHEMSMDGHEEVQIIAPVPLPIEHPVATVQQQSAATAAARNVVKMFIAAAEAVADAILVSTGFENGEGSILVRLQPEVLDGSEVQITVKGGTLTVIVNPASQDVQMIVEANRTQFEQHLAEKVHSWRVAIAVKKRGENTDERV